MELVKLGLKLTLLIVSMLCHGAEAQTSCTGTLIGLSQCLNYVTGNSSTPSSSCCSQLLTVVQSQPQCLCAVLNGGAAILGLNINQTLATSLPDACYIKKPPIGQCNNGSNGPVTPATPPTSLPSDPSDDDEPGTPATASQTSNPSAGTGSKTLPSVNESPSGGGTKRGALQLIVIVIFLVSCIAIKM
ncbi:hypothetical protein L6164_034527 [Bauhinia variegata]|uniref:Uncharacterized protein n=1 Tax=Bauhinia variegata TaxID=167791 RepID=A0ACB9KVQ6_BAUVA|nr:hypothetical protein L6164_034527 [Bauhinia variegata]